jgi:hypothetical protein
VESGRVGGRLEQVVVVLVSVRARKGSPGC